MVLGMEQKMEQKITMIIVHLYLHQRQQPGRVPEYRSTTHFFNVIATN
jgi:hypothetical protein